MVPLAFEGSRFLEVVHLERKLHVLGQITVIGQQRVDVHVGQQVVAGQPEDHPDPIILVFRIQR